REVGQQPAQPFRLVAVAADEARGAAGGRVVADVLVLEGAQLLLQQEGVIVAVRQREGAGREVDDLAPLQSLLQGGSRVVLFPDPFRVHRQASLRFWSRHRTRLGGAARL